VKRQPLFNSSQTKSRYIHLARLAKKTELPLGLAIKANHDVMNLEHELLEKFINWLKNLFVFEE
jgi:hypothetical protein